MRFSLLLTLLIALGCSAETESPQQPERFCLSGGYESGYSCAVEKAYGSRKSTYAIQFLVDRGREDELARHLNSAAWPLRHSQPVSEGLSFYYYGEFEAKDAAREQLLAADKAADFELLGFQPMLVNFSSKEGELPRISLVEDGVGLAIPAALKPPAAGAPEELAAIGRTVYTLQMGAFKSAASRERLLARVDVRPVYCRQKNNGLYVAYHGRYASAAEARSALSGLAQLQKLGAYPVKLEGVALLSCEQP